MKTALRLLAALWLFGTPIVVSCMLLANGHLLGAIAAFVLLGWGWLTTALGMVLIDRKWFVYDPEMGVQKYTFVEGIYKFNIDVAPNIAADFMKGWLGFALPGRILLRQDIKPGSTTVVHEARHVLQQVVFGPLFLPLYYLNSFVLWAMQRAGSKVNPYRDNLFERDARRVAGERVD